MEEKERLVCDLPGPIPAAWKNEGYLKQYTRVQYYRATTKFANQQQLELYNKPINTDVLQEATSLRK